MGETERKVCGEECHPYAKCACVMVSMCSTVLCGDTHILSEEFFRNHKNKNLPVFLVVIS